MCFGTFSGSISFEEDLTALEQLSRISVPLPSNSRILGKAQIFDTSPVKPQISYAEPEPAMGRRSRLMEKWMLNDQAMCQMEFIPGMAPHHSYR